jgi:gamma-glutamyltranspeptidase/glutathione hydrolase
MGGHYQPVGHVQILTNLMEYAQDPQTALDGPRSFAYGGELQIETGVPAATAQALARRGHKVVARGTPFGGGQIIMVDHERGVLIGGSDPRKDGLALGY